MSNASRLRSDEFLKISAQFKLGSLVTESSHPVTANLSETARADIAAALKLLFQVDDDVLATYRAFVASGRAADITAEVLQSLRLGGRIFFTGCGSTGRLSILLDSVWRDFWHRQPSGAAEFENRTFSVMAGGDFALIKSVEGFEDFTAFGRRQINDLGVRAGDVVFAITEGGETSFVIGTAWAGLDAGAKVYFVYNNPDDILNATVERSREVIAEPRIEKINLTTGPMAITGSTRMQATSIQLCVVLTVLEMVIRELQGGNATVVPETFLANLASLLANLQSPALLADLAKLVALEETTYRSGHKNNYFADRLGIDVLTDTTERSPTYCTPPFRKFDDTTATESWAFLFLPCAETPAAWQHIIKREPRCVEWDEPAVRQLVPEDKLARTLETIRKISRKELLRFRIGLDGMAGRPLGPGDCAVAVFDRTEPPGFFQTQLAVAAATGAVTGCLYFGSIPATGATGGETPPEPAGEDACATRLAVTVPVFVPVPQTGLRLDGITRVAVKLVMNALSTCTMVRLGRVMGNYMIWVVPSNLKLIDRATRYITRLTGLDYEAANQLLFEIIEYVEPRMKTDQAYPPVVGMAVLRAREGLSNEEAEKKLRET
jgi:N-acetylmuramic acid 6-phosphate etherase